MRVYAQTAAPSVGRNFIRVPTRFPAARVIQAKLAINRLGDEYEQEAERVSDQLMRTSEPTPLAISPEPPSTLQRKCPECTNDGGSCPHCAEEEAKMMRTKPPVSQISRLARPPVIDEPPGMDEPAAAAGTRQANEVIRSQGQPLDLATRAFMEPRFGHDFSHVRVHTDENSARSARTLNAHAYTVGNDIVFGLGRLDSTTAVGRRLLAHELTHVVQQTAGHAPRALARQPADAEKESPEAAPKATPKPSKCHTGCAQRWGEDTTCSKWGFFQGVAEKGEGKKWRSIDCCNSWPLSVEHYARTHLGLSGAASCTVRHQREIATVSLGGKEVDVLCSDTVPNSMFGETRRASGCKGKITTEVIELSHNAMQDLSGQTASALHVKVCYSGSKEDLCLHNGPGAAKFPTIFQCLTKGCTPWEGTPTTHKDSGWRRE